jgi:DHA2 family multidrug resistance protein
VLSRIQKHREWIAISGAMLGAFLAVLDIVITNAAIKDIQGALSATFDEASLISTAYLVAEIIVIPLSGWLMKMLSMRRYFLISCGLFTFSSLLCSFAWNLESMIVFRVLQGFGGGALVPLGFTIIMTMLPLKQRAMGMALFAFTATTAPALGPTLGGWLVEQFSWHYIFYINLPAGILMMAMLSYGLDKTRPDWSQLRHGDYTGILTMAIGLGSLEVMLEMGRRVNWFESDLIISLALISFTSLATFIFIELRSDNPLINLRLLKQKNFALASLSNILMGYGLFGTVFVLPLYLAGVHGYNSMQIGIVFMWMGLPQLLLLPIVPRLMTHIEPRYLVSIGFALFSVSCYMSTGLNSDFAGEQLIIPQLLRALGQPLAMVPIIVIATQQVALKDVASASSLFNLLRKLGGALGIALLATILQTRRSTHFAHINETVNVISAQTQAHMASLSQSLLELGTAPTLVEQQTLVLVAELIQREASIMAFSDTMFLLGAGLALASVFILPAGLKSESHTEDTAMDQAPAQVVAQN